MTKEQIKLGLDKAYKKAGHNAYFENGFEAGVKFALDAQNTSSNSDYAKCSKEIYDLFYYGSANKEYIENVLRKHFA